MRKVRVLFIAMLCLTLSSMSLTTVSAYTDFTRKQSATYVLSNGSTVRIEYHNGKPHIHEKTKNGKWNRSENILDESAHHKGESKLTKSTRDIVKKGKTKSQRDKAAHKKAKQLGEDYKEYEKAKKRSKSKTKDFAKKNEDTIKEAASTSAGIVVIGGILYCIYELAKLLPWVFVLI